MMYTEMTANEIIAERLFQHSFHQKSKNLTRQETEYDIIDKDICDVQKNYQSHEQNNHSALGLPVNNSISISGQVRLPVSEVNTQKQEGFKEWQNANVCTIIADSIPLNSQFPQHDRTCTGSMLSGLASATDLESSDSTSDTSKSSKLKHQNPLFPFIKNTDHVHNDNKINTHHTISDVMMQFSALKMVEPSDMVGERNTDLSSESLSEEEPYEYRVPQIAGVGLHTDKYSQQKDESESHSATSVKLPSVSSVLNSEWNSDVVIGNATKVDKELVKRARSRLSQKLRRRNKKERRKKSSEKRKNFNTTDATGESNVFSLTSCLSTAVQSQDVNQRVESLQTDILVTKPSNLKERLIKSKQVYKTNAPTGNKPLQNNINCRISTSKNVSDNVIKNSMEVHSSPIRQTSNQRSVPYSTQEELEKVVKIYLSERQSGVIKVAGVELPCAPPSTPLPDHLKHYKYIPSLTDNKAQRTMKVRLQALEKADHRKSEKRKEEQIKMEKMYHKNQERELKHRQRLEVYALNKVMTELENNRFLEYCKAKGIDP